MSDQEGKEGKGRWGFRGLIDKEVSRLLFTDDVSKSCTWFTQCFNKKGDPTPEPLLNQRQYRYSGSQVQTNCVYQVISTSLFCLFYHHILLEHIFVRVRQNVNYGIEINAKHSEYLAIGAIWFDKWRRDTCLTYLLKKGFMLISERYMHLEKRKRGWALNEDRYRFIYKAKSYSLRAYTHTHTHTPRMLRVSELFNCRGSVNHNNHKRESTFLPLSHHVLHVFISQSNSYAEETTNVFMYWSILLKHTMLVWSIYEGVQSSILEYIVG